MFYYYADFLRELHPEMFFFENVKGLLSHDHGQTFETILHLFEQQGYVVQYQVLNAWDYGVAQKRERLIMIGVRNDLKDKIAFHFPIPHSYRPVLKDIKLDVHPSIDECAYYSREKEEIFSLVPAGGYWRDIDQDIARRYMKSCYFLGGGRTGILRRLSLFEPSLTVLTSPGMKQTDRCHPLEVRPFSYRENARIQTFDDDWVFCGTLNQKYKQIGNAVPVNLAKDIGFRLKESLENI